MDFDSEPLYSKFTTDRALYLASPSLLTDYWTSSSYNDKLRSRNTDRTYILAVKRYNYARHGGWNSSHDAIFGTGQAQYGQNICLKIWDWERLGYHGYGHSTRTDIRSSAFNKFKYMNEWWYLVLTESSSHSQESSWQGTYYNNNFSLYATNNGTLQRYWSHTREAYNIGSYFNRVRFGWDAGDSNARFNGQIKYFALFTKKFTEDELNYLIQPVIDISQSSLIFSNISKKFHLTWKTLYHDTNAIYEIYDSTNTQVVGTVQKTQVSSIEYDYFFEVPETYDFITFESIVVRTTTATFTRNKSVNADMLLFNDYFQNIFMLAFYTENRVYWHDTLQHPSSYYVSISANDTEHLLSVIHTTTINGSNYFYYDIVLNNEVITININFYGIIKKTVLNTNTLPTYRGKNISFNSRVNDDMYLVETYMLDVSTDFALNYNNDAVISFDTAIQKLNSYYDFMTLTEYDTLRYKNYIVKFYFNKIVIKSTKWRLTVLSAQAHASMIQITELYPVSNEIKPISFELMFPHILQLNDEEQSRYYNIMDNNLSDRSSEINMGFGEQITYFFQNDVQIDTIKWATRDDAGRTPKSFRVEYEYNGTWVHYYDVTIDGSYSHQTLHSSSIIRPDYPYYPISYDKNSTTYVRTLSSIFTLSTVNSLPLLDDIELEGKSTYKKTSLHTPQGDYINTLFPILKIRKYFDFDTNKFNIYWSSSDSIYSYSIYEDDTLISSPNIKLYSSTDPFNYSYLLSSDSVINVRINILDDFIKYHENTTHTNIDTTITSTNSSSNEMMTISNLQFKYIYNKFYIYWYGYVRPREVNISDMTVTIWNPYNSNPYWYINRTFEKIDHFLTSQISDKDDIYIAVPSSISTDDFYAIRIETKISGININLSTSTFNISSFNIPSFNTSYNTSTFDSNTLTIYWTSDLHIGKYSLSDVNGRAIISNIELESDSFESDNKHHFSYQIERIYDYMSPLYITVSLFTNSLHRTDSATCGKTIQELLSIFTAYEPIVEYIHVKTSASDTGTYEFRYSNNIISTDLIYFSILRSQINTSLELLDAFETVTLIQEHTDSSYLKTLLQAQFIVQEIANYYFVKYVNDDIYYIKLTNASYNVDFNASQIAIKPVHILDNGIRYQIQISNPLDNVYSKYNYIVDSTVIDTKYVYTNDSERIVFFTSYCTLDTDMIGHIERIHEGVYEYENTLLEQVELNESNINDNLLNIFNIEIQRNIISEDLYYINITWDSYFGGVYNFFINNENILANQVIVIQTPETKKFLLQTAESEPRVVNSVLNLEENFNNGVVFEIDSISESEEYVLLKRDGTNLYMRHQDGYLYFHTYEENSEDFLWKIESDGVIKSAYLYPDSYLGYTNSQSSLFLVYPGNNLIEGTTYDNFHYIYEDYYGKHLLRFGEDESHDMNEFVQNNITSYSFSLSKKILYKEVLIDFPLTQFNISTNISNITIKRLYFNDVSTNIEIEPVMDTSIIQYNVYHNNSLLQEFVLYNIDTILELLDGQLEVFENDKLEIREQNILGQETKKGKVFYITLLPIENLLITRVDNLYTFSFMYDFYTCVFSLYKSSEDIPTLSIEGQSSDTYNIEFNKYEYKFEIVDANDDNMYGSWRIETLFKFTEIVHLTTERGGVFEINQPVAPKNLICYKKDENENVHTLVFESDKRFTDSIFRVHIMNEKGDQSPTVYTIHEINSPTFEFEGQNQTTIRAQEISKLNHVSEFSEIIRLTKPDPIRRLQCTFDGTKFILSWF